MTPAELDTIEDTYREAGRKPGSLMEAFFYATVPKLLRALRESANLVFVAAYSCDPLPAVSPPDLTPRFKCPKCDGIHFGTRNYGTPDMDRICHDQFAIGCNWHDPDAECMQPEKESPDA